jgi:hypothetical protein
MYELEARIHALAIQCTELANIDKSDEHDVARYLRWQNIGSDILFNGAQPLQPLTK